MSTFRYLSTAVEPFVLGEATDEEVRACILRWRDAAYDALAAARDQEDEDFDAAMRRRVRERTDDLEDE